MHFHQQLGDWERGCLELNKGVGVMPLPATFLVIQRDFDRRHGSTTTSSSQRSEKLDFTFYASAGTPVWTEGLVAVRIPA